MFRTTHWHLSRISFLLGTCLLIISTLVTSAETGNKAFVKGSFAEIKQQHQGQPYIISFWSETCSYCMEELALFGKFLKNYPDVTLVNITTDSFLDDQIVAEILVPRNVADTETWVFAENFPERLYYDVDKRWRGELPLTYFIDRNNKIIKHMGIVTENNLIEWLNSQQQAL